MANKKTAEHRDAAHRLRESIVTLLGGKCAQCGSRKNPELDHIDPGTRTWVATKFSQWGRARQYWKDYEKGFLQVLCKKHNQKKSNHAS